MTYKGKYPAAFINSIAEEGTKAEAIEWLQKTWDELVDERKRVAELYDRLVTCQDAYLDYPPD